MGLWRHDRLRPRWRRASLTGRIGVRNTLRTPMRTECATVQTGQVAAFAQVSGLRKETITASEAI
jgi:hypothetical protein